MSAALRDPLDVIHAVLSASEERDADAYLAHYLEDAVMRRADGSVLTGKAAIARNFEDYVASGRARHVDIFESFNLVQGDIALVCTSYRMTVAGGAEEDLIHGTSHDVLKRQNDGSWLLAIDHPYEPAAPPRRDGLDEA